MSVKEAVPIAQASPAQTGVVDLALFAPRNESVELLAQWNQYRPVPMARGDDGWWRASATLPDGTYQYRFRVKSLSWFAQGQMVEVGDPYAVQILIDASDDALVRVKDGKRVWVDFQWQHDEVLLPTNDCLIIYEMHIGDFTGTPEHTGTFKLAITKLDYLAQMGINAIELMPIKESFGRQWGYSLRSLFAIEADYGTAAEFCHFVDECHARGIRVIVDGVYNHMHMDAWMAKIDYELWFHRENPDGPDLDFGPKFDYGRREGQAPQSPAMRYVADSIRFMVEKYHIDGIRFDCTSAIANFDVLRELSETAYAKVGVRKPFICIAEHIPEDPAIVGREHGAPMDAAWCDHLGRRLQAVVSRATVSNLSPGDLEGLLQAMDPQRNGYQSPYRMITFLGNHDHKRPMQMIGEDGQAFGEMAFRRMTLGHAILLGMPGIPMIWMGSEFGMPSDKSPDPRPLTWSLLENGDNAALLRFHQRAIALRKDIPALRGDGFQVLLCDQQRMLMIWKRWNEQGSVALLAANVADEPADITIEDSNADDGDWIDRYTDEKFHMAQGKIALPIGKSQVRLLVRL